MVVAAMPMLRHGVATFFGTCFNGNGLPESRLKSRFGDSVAHFNGDVLRLFLEIHSLRTLRGPQTLTLGQDECKLKL
jgi:hypothetical protein